MSSKELIRNIKSSLILKFFSLLYGFIVPIIIIENYGSEVNGLVTSVKQFLAYIVLLEAGIGPVIKNALFKPIVEKNKDDIKNILSSANKFFKGIAYVFLIYIIILCIIYPNFVQQDYSRWFTISIILVISISQFFEYFLGMTYKLYLQADGKNFVIDYIHVITYILDIILVYILVNNNFSIQIVKLACSLIYLIRPIAIKYYFDKKYGFKLDKKSDFKLDKKWDALFHHIAYTVQENTDIIVLTLFSTLSKVSVYSVYLLIVAGIRNIITALTNGLDAFLGKIMVTDNKKELKEKFSNYNFTYFTIITIILSCTLVLILPFVKIYTKNIMDANYIQPVFAYILIFAEFNYIIRYPYSTLVFAKGHFKETKVFSIIEPIVNIIISILLVRKYNLIGVAIGTFVSMLIRSFGFIIYAIKNILDDKILPNLKLVFLSFFEMFIIFLVNLKFISINPTNYFEWIIYAIVSFGLISLFVISINSILYKDKVKIIINIFKRFISKSNIKEKTR